MKTCKNGLHQYPKELKSCKDCRRISNQRWAKQNEEQKHSSYKRYYSSNKNKINAASREYHKLNKVKIKAQQKEYETLNKNKTYKKRREWFIKDRYGLSIEQLNNLYRVQSGSCAICKITELDLTKSLNIDHCHKTGKVRGLLCGDCNRALGLFKDRFDLCFSAGQYLQQHEQPSQESHNDNCLVPCCVPSPNE